jgi:hypothetical protein
MANYTAYTNPSIFLFPRAGADLFDSEVGSDKKPTGRIQVHKALPGYKAAAVPAGMPQIDAYDKNTSDGTVFYEAEYNVYTDLWGTDETVTKKAVTVCLLKNTGNGYNVYDKTVAESCPVWYGSETGNGYKIEVRIENNKTGKSIWLETVDGNLSNKGKDDTPLTLFMTDLDNNFMRELRICVADPCKTFPDTSSRSFDLTVKLSLEQEKQRSLTFSLFRYKKGLKKNEKEPFSFLKSDRDFFILPRKGHEPADSEAEAVKTCIKHLQFLNNQVLTRNAAYKEAEFVDENGAYTETLVKSVGKAAEKFRATKSGNVVNDVKSVFPYSFENFGQSKEVIEYLKLNYSVSESVLRGIIIDTDFLYGKDSTAADFNTVGGMENLYTVVVKPFLDSFVEEARRYANFPHKWLSRPKNNWLYQRGDLMITGAMHLCLYSNEKCTTKIVLKSSGIHIFGITIGGSSVTELPEGTVVSFYSGADGFDSDTTGGHPYQVKQVKIPPFKSVIKIKMPVQETKKYGETGNNRAWIKLGYAEKKLCDDSKFAQNYSTYVDETKLAGLSAEDRKSVSQYMQSNGVPYYISEGGSSGGKYQYSVFEEHLGTVPKNWYLYADSPAAKPNCPRSGSDIHGIGLDCSGLVMNCLLDTKVNGRKFFKENSENTRSYGQSAARIGKNQTKIIPQNILTAEDDTLLQKGEILYSSDHIMVLSQEKTVTQTQLLSTRNFNIIHNYGQFANPKKNKQTGEKYWKDKRSYIWIDLASEPFSSGFFMKTLEGRFRNAGLKIDNSKEFNDDEPGITHTGRLYLWY